MREIVIVGGGLAGLISAILLNRNGEKVKLLEKNQYPFHRVCGEYVSNEVIPFLKKSRLFPKDFDPVEINQFLLSSISGKNFTMPLDLGGFGISRYDFDQWLAHIARQEGVDVQENTYVKSVDFNDNRFQVQTKSGNQLEADIVVGSHGKRSVLDKSLDRPFMHKRSPYVGVKYHINSSLADAHTIALHNFEGGYCGINAINHGRFNLCYLTKRDNLKKYGSIPEMERQVLCKNPFLKSLFSESAFLFSTPETINEISFSPKEPVFNHVLMAGDAAGMITPLSGNGMAMAIHGASILAQTLANCSFDTYSNRQNAEAIYSQAWKSTFSFRHWSGRKIQALFGTGRMSELAVAIGRQTPLIARILMSKTHGLPF